MLTQTTRSHTRVQALFANTTGSASSWLWTQPPLPPCHALAPDQADSADP